MNLTFKFNSFVSLIIACVVASNFVEILLIANAVSELLFYNPGGYSSSWAECGDFSLFVTSLYYYY